MPRKQTSSELAEFSTESPAKIKRVIGVTSDKGGNGKSTVARVLADIMLQRGIPALAFDCDRRNAQLYRFYNQEFASAFNSKIGVQRVDLLNLGGGDKLINRLAEASPPIALIDFPAGGGELFERFERDTNFFEILDDLGYRLTMVSVINRDRDSVNSLRTLLQFCGDRADYVVILNSFFGKPSEFITFNTSNTKELIEKQGGITLSLPKLAPDVYHFLDGKNLPFSSALSCEIEMSYMERKRTGDFLKDSEAEMMKAAQFLGL